MIEAGKILQQRYRVDKQIGQGGMGAVYVGTDERFGSLVAIKETLCMDSSFRKAIEREARLLNSLKHAALPRVSDHFEENNSQFLVMEYVPGDDLGQILDERRRPFEIDQVTRWAEQLLEALDYLHNQEIPVIHRDIKPQNLKVAANGQIVLLDFGLAKGNPTDAGHQTAAKSIFGYSRNYASLEQIQGTGTDPRSDLYSLSATIYHLLTGVSPEDALTRAMSVLGAGPDPLRPACAIRPDVPAGLAGVLMRSMDLNASARPSTASEMRQMLRDSERYEHLAGDVPASSTVAARFAQPTQIMPVSTNAVAGGAVEAQTEVMPEHLSELTSVRSVAASALAGGRDTGTGSPDNGNSPVRRVLAAGAGLLMLVAVAIGGGAYFYKYGSVQSWPASVEKIDLPAANRSANVPDPKGGGLIDVPANAAAQPANLESPTPSTTVSKAPETTKTSKTPASDKNAGRDENIDIEGSADEDIPGDIVVTKRNPDGSVSTTRILKNGNHPPNAHPPANQKNPFPPGVDPRVLTPAQRKHFRDLMRMSRQRPIPPDDPQN